MLVQPRRDKRAALRLLRTLLKKLGFAPKLLVTDKLRSYGSEFRHLRLTCPHEQGLRSKIERRTLIRWCGDESARCNGSNQHDPPNAFSASMPRSTTTSMFNATSSPDPACETSAPKQPRSGRLRLQRHDTDQFRLTMRVSFVTVTTPWRRYESSAIAS